jgi:hypothetical protein
MLLNNLEAIRNDVEQNWKKIDLPSPPPPPSILQMLSFFMLLDHTFKNFPTNCPLGSWRHSKMFSYSKQTRMM